MAVEILLGGETSDTLLETASETATTIKETITGVSDEVIKKTEEEIREALETFITTAGEFAGDALETVTQPDKDYTNVLEVAAAFAFAMGDVATFGASDLLLEIIGLGDYKDKIREENPGVTTVGNLFGWLNPGLAIKVLALGLKGSARLAKIIFKSSGGKASGSWLKNLFATQRARARARIIAAGGITAVRAIKNVDVTTKAAFAAISKISPEMAKIVKATPALLIAYEKFSKATGMSFDECIRAMLATKAVYSHKLDTGSTISEALVVALEALTGFVLANYGTKKIPGLKKWLSKGAGREFISRFLKGGFGLSGAYILTEIANFESPTPGGQQINSANNLLQTPHPSGNPILQGGI